MQIKYILFLLLFPLLVFSQKKITLINADIEEVKANLFNGNLVYSGNVILEHEGSKFSADSVIFYQKENKIEGRGNITFTDKENIMTCEKIFYNGNTKIATAFNRVLLKSPEQRVETEKMEYNVNTEVAYFDNWGTIYSKEDVINTKEARYYSREKRTEFLVNTHLENPQYTVDGDNIQFYSDTHIVDFFGNTIIRDKNDPNSFIISEKGKYNTITKEAYLKKNNKVYYDKKVLHGDAIYFNQIIGFGKAKGNVKIIDPKEKRYLRGGYGEVYQKKDSAIIIDKPLAVKVFEKDKLFFHSDTIIALKHKGSSLIRGYHNARIFKSELSGKCDSITFNENTGKVDFYKEPIIWNGYKQITGDSITAYLNVKNSYIDSIYIRNNAFMINKVDSLSPKKEFDQVKGNFMKAYFKENSKLKEVKVIGNSESVIYADQEKENGKKERIGISKSSCGYIIAEFNNNSVDAVSCNINSETVTYPENLYPADLLFLKGFNWKGNEKLLKWTDVFIK